MAERISGGRSRQGIRLDEAALRARDDMLRVLASWAGAVAAEHGPAGPDRREVHALAAFLVRRLDHLVAHPAAGECAGEVRRVTDAARSAVRPRPVVRRELGPCPVAGCGEPVRAEADADAPVTAHTVRCGAGHSVPPHQWLLLDRRAA
ncbi:MULTISPECIES: hypothetical protein [Streptomyces]|uniref:hypothetical protein n=1 Tax=Streptomyces TaxID=1883 RepID=UPI000B1E35F5|nr:MULTISPECIES: hypothetical protein [Streptomyces]